MYARPNTFTTGKQIKLRAHTRCEGAGGKELRCRGDGLDHATLTVSVLDSVFILLLIVSVNKEARVLSKQEGTSASDLTMRWHDTPFLLTSSASCLPSINPELGFGYFVIPVIFDRNGSPAERRGNRKRPFEPELGRVRGEETVSIVYKICHINKALGGSPSTDPFCRLQNLINLRTAATSYLDVRTIIAYPKNVWHPVTSLMLSCERIHELGNSLITQLL
ncbi:hypothetical protein J6590_008461 [Homalodisca vitripennis]|nr:hypothetical protein J6590_008461 [Homalodisca vitripennis]